MLAPLPVNGGLHLDDATRPEGAHAFSLNVRGGVVRPGSLLEADFTDPNTGLAGLNHDPFPNGAAYITAPNGLRYVVVAGYDNVAGTARVDIILGARVVHTGTVHDYGSAAAAHRPQSIRHPVTWGVLLNQLLFAGPMEGTIGVVQFNDDGTFLIEAARGEDREREGNENGAGDDAGPYLHCAPRADVLRVHQERVVVYERERGVLRFSNLRDPHGWPVNNVFDESFEAVNALFDGGFGKLYIASYDLWSYDGPLVGLAGALRREGHGVRVVGPAAVQVTGSGQIMALTASGPKTWVAGQDIPTGALGLDLGGVGSIAPLFQRGSASMDVLLEQYRPHPSMLFETISRYSTAENAVEWALPVALSDSDDPQDRRLRIRYDLGARRWSMEVHPPARALLALPNGDTEDLLIRFGVGAKNGIGGITPRFARVVYEGIGDEDYSDQIGSAGQHVIEGELYTPPIRAGSTRARLRRVLMHLLADHTSRVEVAVLGEGQSRDAEQATSAPAEDRATVAFSSDGSSDGFVLGTSLLETQRTLSRRRGLPPNAVGPWTRILFRTPAASLPGHRWGLAGAEFEVMDTGRRAGRVA